METKQLYDDEKVSLIKKYIENKDVLDLGSGGYGDFYVYDELNKLCNLTGSDIRDLKDNMEYIDVNKDFNINKTFDVITMLDLIEHTSNPGNLIRNCKKHLKKNGSIVLITPNPLSLNTIITLLCKGYYTANREHKILFDEYVLKNLFEEYGFNNVKFEYYTPLVKSRNKLYPLSYILLCITKLIGKVYKQLNYNVICIAQK